MIELHFSTAFNFHSKIEYSDTILRLSPHPRKIQNLQSEKDNIGLTLSSDTF